MVLIVPKYTIVMINMAHTEKKKQIYVECILRPRKVILGDDLTFESEKF